MAAGGGDNYPVWLLIIGSILSSVCLVMINKRIFALGFPYVFTLSTFHFIVTCGLLQVMARVFGQFQVAYLPFKTNLLVASFGVGSICLMNFSLKLNSIGFYQMMKLVVVPCCLVINAASYGEYATRKVIATLLIVLAGVGIATVTDLELNFAGSVFGVAAVAVTAQYQIWQGRKQKEAGMSGHQLALSVSLFQIFIGAFLAIIFESQDLLLARSHSGGAASTPGFGGADSEDSESTSLVGLILVSCVLAVSVNVHSFALIGKTSAVTFQVVGHGKTCLILLSGYVMHVQQGNPLSDLYKNIFGVCVALFGVVIYGNLKLRESSNSDWCGQFLPRSMLALLSDRSGYAAPGKPPVGP